MRKNIYKTWMFLAVALFCLMGALPLSAQQRTVSGTVVDNDGNPLAGALVSVTGSNERIAITDADGGFSLQAASNETLTVSFFGYLNSVVPAAQTQLMITLEADNTMLEEVVVVGYGTQRRATLTGAVSSVGNREITVTRNENVVNMLSGKLPGVRIMQSSSQPGNYEDTKIDIRGMGQPLIIVDGIERDKNYFSSMDSNEIDNVSVLKDASAAIYGVRAANGVLLVTTKRGSSAEGFNITFSANYGIQDFLYVPHTASAVDHMLLMNEKRQYVLNNNYPYRTSPKFTWLDMMEYSTGAKQGVDWTEEVFRNNVPVQQYNVSVDGGSDKVNYFFNVGYMDHEGAYKSGSLNFKRWNFRNNTDVKITNRLKATIQLGGYISERNEPNADMWDIHKKVWSYIPNSNVWIDGNHDLPAFDVWGTDGTDNPAALTDSRFTGRRNYKNTNVNGSLALTYDIPGVKGLNVRAFYNYDYFATNNMERRRTYDLYQRREDGTLETFVRNEPPKNSTIKRSANPGNAQTMNLSLNYANKFGDHNVSGLLLYEERYGESDGFAAQRVMLLEGEYIMLGESDGQMGYQDGGPSEWARKALVGRVNYDWKGRYMVETAFRYDGSSIFSKLGTWGFFPSVSAGWRISEEPFVKNAVPFLTNLKLRASYGVMGDDGDLNRQVMGYELRPSDVGWYYDESLVIGVTPLATPNLELTWYTAKTANIGLDFDLWNAKLTGSVDLFMRNRSGLKATSSSEIPTEIGAAMPQENLESDKTFGWEIQLGHRNRIGDWDYWVSGQISATKNRWNYRMDTPGGNSLDVWRRKDQSGRNKDIWFVNEEEGGRFSSYEDIRWHNLPVDQGALPGDYWYQDWNGDGVVNGDDRHPVATFNLPVFNYGISAGVEWKGINLTMHWQGAAGVYNTYGSILNEVGPFENGAALDIYMDRWHMRNVGDDPWNPATEWVEGFYPATGHKFDTGSTGIKNASYIRLKTLELGYNFPDKWLKVVGVKGFRVYTSAYNLLTFTGLKNIDPERPGDRGVLNDNPDRPEDHTFYRYPVNRTINIGATLKF